jgi:hypothetical protein
VSYGLVLFEFEFEKKVLKRLKTMADEGVLGDK